MHIDFGWTADGATWADARGRSSHGRARMGPRTLVQLLQTRLGLTRPAVEPAVRIAQYMTLVQQHLTAVRDEGSFWPARSFRVDPWNTTRQLLRWRDAAVEAGWVAPGREHPLPPRLAALRDLEAAVVVGMPGTADAAGHSSTLSPSAADDLVEVCALLDELEHTGDSWPLGIETLVAQENPERLPGLWPRLIAALARHGVDVTVDGPGPAVTAGGPAPVPVLDVVECQDEWTAADVAARFLAAPAGDDGLTLLAGGDTTVLDLALRRRGLPAAGVVASSTDRGTHQVLGLFLDVVTAPVDVHQLAALLDLRVRPAGPDRAEPVGVVPAATRRALIRALTRQPGVGGPAWTQALDELVDRVDTADDDRRRAGAQRALAAARGIDALVTDPLPADGALPADIADRVEWLAERLRSTSAGDGTLSAAHASVRTLQTVLALLDPDVVLSQATLRRIVAGCGGSGRSPLAGAQAAPWQVTTHPAQITDAGGTVLWWAPEGDEAPAPVLWDGTEQSALLAGGAHLIDHEQLVALHVEAALRGMYRAARVTAVLPGRRLESAPSPSGLLAHLESLAGRGEKDRTNPESLIDDDGSWALAGRSVRVRMPELRGPAAPADLHRRFTPNPQLLPRRLSFTSAQTLVGCPLHWMLEYALDVRPAAAAALPTGAQMIGTLVHAVVEDLVHEHWDDGLGAARLTVPSDAEIGAAFDRLVPRLASELELPGRLAERSDVRLRTIRSLRTLFTGAVAAGLRITGTEVRFDHPLTLALERGDRTIDFVGSRDLDLEDGRGTPMVIDLKWSHSGTRYADLYDTGDAVQLASYAWAREQDGAASLPAQVGYFLLRSGEFISAHPDLDPQERSPLDVRGSWDRLRNSVTDALDAIAFGQATAGCRALHDAAGIPIGAPDHQHRKAVENARDSARARGRVAVDSYCATSDYAQLCGMRGDDR